jgi:hypothetical protein
VAKSLITSSRINLRQQVFSPNVLISLYFDHLRVVHIKRTYGHSTLAQNTLSAVRMPLWQVN